MLNGGTLLPMGAGKDLLIKQEIRSYFSFMINTYLRALPSLLYPPLDLEFYSLKGGHSPYMLKIEGCSLHLILWFPWRNTFQIMCPRCKL